MQAAGGAAPDDGSIIGRVEDRYTGEPVAGELVVIDGVPFASDEQGLVHAPKPPGAYDAMVLHPVDLEHDVTVYEQLTHTRPVFYVGRKPVAPVRTAQVDATFSRPSFYKGDIWFTTRGRVFHGQDAGDGSFWMVPSWTGPVSLEGVFHGLAIETDASGQASTYWYGSTPATLVATDLDVDVSLGSTQLDVHTLELRVEPPSSSFEGMFFFGPRFIGVATHSPSKHVIPDPRPLGVGGTQPTLILVCPGNSGAARTTPPLPSDVDELTVTCPATPSLVSPVADAVVARDEPFRIEAKLLPCRHVSFRLPGLNVSIFTTRDQVKIPDLRVGDVVWPASAAGSWNLFANGPCTSADFYVSPETGRYLAPRGVTTESSNIGNSLIEGFTDNRPFTTAPP